MSRNAQSSPRRFISASIERATMSRGASLACVVARHERVARRVAEDAALAAQRLADEEALRLWVEQAGRVNWKNSMFAMDAPARYAIATPSPVETSGFEV